MNIFIICLIIPHLIKSELTLPNSIDGTNITVLNEDNHLYMENTLYFDMDIIIQRNQDSITFDIHYNSESKESTKNIKVEVPGNRRHLNTVHQLKILLKFFQILIFIIFLVYLVSNIHKLVLLKYRPMGNFQNNSNLVRRSISTEKNPRNLSPENMPSRYKSVQSADEFIKRNIEPIQKTDSYLLKSLRSEKSSKSEDEIMPFLEKALFDKPCLKPTCPAHNFRFKCPYCVYEALQYVLGMCDKMNNVLTSSECCRKRIKCRPTCCSKSCCHSCNMNCHNASSKFNSALCNLTESSHLTIKLPLHSYNAIQSPDNVKVTPKVLTKSTTPIKQVKSQYKQLNNNEMSKNVRDSNPINDRTKHSKSRRSTKSKHTQSPLDNLNTSQPIPNCLIKAPDENYILHSKQDDDKENANKRGCPSFKGENVDVDESKKQPNFDDTVFYASNATFPSIKGETFIPPLLKEDSQNMDVENQYHGTDNYKLNSSKDANEVIIMENEDDNIFHTSIGIDLFKTHSFEDIYDDINKKNLDNNMLHSLNDKDHSKTHSSINTYKNIDNQDNNMLHSAQDLNHSKINSFNNMLHSAEDINHSKINSFNNMLHSGQDINHSKINSIKDINGVISKEYEDHNMLYASKYPNFNPQYSRENGSQQGKIEPLIPRDASMLKQSAPPYDLISPSPEYAVFGTIRPGDQIVKVNSNPDSEVFELLDSTKVSPIPFLKQYAYPKNVKRVDNYSRSDKSGIPTPSNSTVKKIDSQSRSQGDPMSLDRNSLNEMEKNKKGPNIEGCREVSTIQSILGYFNCQGNHNASQPEIKKSNRQFKYHQNESITNTCCQPYICFQNPCANKCVMLCMRNRCCKGRFR